MRKGGPQWSRVSGSWPRHCEALKVLPLKDRNHKCAVELVIKVECRWKENGSIFFPVVQITWCSPWPSPPSTLSSGSTNATSSSNQQWNILWVSSFPKSVRVEEWREARGEHLKTPKGGTQILNGHNRSIRYDARGAQTVVVLWPDVGSSSEG